MNTQALIDTARTLAVELGLHAATATAEPDICATDIVTAVVPLTALAVAYFKDDTEGEKQWLRNIVVNQVLTSALRVGFNETSIPSGNKT